MKILVVSDSHGDVDNLCAAVEQSSPEMVLHLGDGWRDAELLAARYPELPLEKVPGNCDYRRDEAAVRLLTLGGKRILICHGHTLGVKSNLSILLRTALEQGADVALFGHTHKPLVDIRRGVVLLNPGSIGSYSRPTYATLEIEGGKCLPATHDLKRTF